MKKGVLFMKRRV